MAETSRGQQRLAGSTGLNPTSVASTHSVPDLEWTSKGPSQCYTQGQVGEGVPRTAVMSGPVERSVPVYGLLLTYLPPVLPFSLYQSSFVVSNA